MEYLQYTDYVNKQIADYYYVVVGFTVHNDETKPVLLLRNVHTGEEIKTRIKQSKIFKAQPFGLFSILKIEGFSYEFKKKMVDGKWENTDEHEPILTEYELMKGYLNEYKNGEM